MFLALTGSTEQIGNFVGKSLKSIIFYAFYAFITIVIY